MAGSTSKRRRKETSAPVDQNKDYISSAWMALDEGHAIIKGCADNGWHDYPHAIMPLDENVWRQILLRGTPGPDYMVINDHPYAIGETAERHGWTGRLEGAARYSEEYYGVMAAAMAFRLFEGSQRDMTVMATHAPEFIDYQRDIREALIGSWKVECNGANRRYEIKRVIFADEPVGGAMNVILTPDGAAFQHTDLQQGTGLVLDIGGFTTDATLLENGVPDYLSIYSEPGIGIIRALEEFKKALRTRYAGQLKNSAILRPAALREALATGKFAAGGYGMLDCRAQADIASDRLVTLVHDIYNRFGGTAGLDYVILTGGGSGLLAVRLRQRLQHPSMYLAGKPEHVHMANVAGALKLMHFYKRHGAF